MIGHVDHDLPNLASLKRDLMDLLDGSPDPGSAALLHAIPRLSFVRAQSQPLSRRVGATAVGETVMDEIRLAIGDLGSSPEGLTARWLFFGEGGIGARRAGAAQDLSVSSRTVARDREARAVSAVAHWLYEKELGFLAETALPYAIIRRDPVMRTIWSTLGHEPVVLTGGEIPADAPHSRGAYNIQAGDVNALLEAYGALRSLRGPTEISIVPSSQVRGALLGRNIVSVGGPRWNRVTRLLLDHLKPPWRFGSIETFGKPSSIIRGGPDDRIVSAATTPEGEVSHTWAFVLSAPNPHNALTRVTVLAGLSTLGVLGATRAIDPIRLSVDHVALAALDDQYLLDCASDVLQVLVEVPVIEGEVVPGNVLPDRITVKPLPRVR